MALYRRSGMPCQRIFSGLFVVLVFRIVERTGQKPLIFAAPVIDWRPAVLFLIVLRLRPVQPGGVLAGPTFLPNRLA